MLGDKPLIIRTVANGDISIGADFILDGGDASTQDGYGGRPVLNPWRGRSSEKLTGYGPGGPPVAGNWGVGANYNYGDDQLTYLLPGSSGSSGRYFQGSGAGGGALSLVADGDLTIEEGVLFSAKGGDGRTNGYQWDHGGGGSGGAISLKGKNVYNRGLVQVNGGNRGAGGGRVVFAADGEIERGVLSLGSGSFVELRPPEMTMPEQLFISYLKPTEVIRRKKVSTRSQNLTLYFPFDEGQGMRAKDEVSGLSSNLVGGYSWENGMLGTAVRFNGSNAYLSTDIYGEDLGVDGKRPRTISFWAKAEGMVGNDPGFYGYGSFLNDGANQYWAIRHIDNSNYARFQSEHWGWGAWSTHGSSILNTWAHFVHLYDGSNMMIYRDGVRVYNGARAEIGTGNQVALQIGRWRNNNNAYFLGLIDDFRVYDDALTETEIQTIALGADTSEEVIEFQFALLAEGDPSSYSISGLPAGLKVDSKSGEVSGLPSEIGVFDLNVTIGNMAGASQSTLQLVVNKTPPTLASSLPKNLSSTSARFAGQVVSDGGEPITLSLFWGDEDGGDSTIVDPSSPVSWDARIDLNSTQSTGAFDFFQDGMDKNKSYYYRWLGGNSVTSEVWSLPTMEGLANMWEFDENTGNEVVNLVNSNNGVLVGMSDADRVFGYKRKALSFDDDGGHLVIRGYKGISRNLPRTLSLWVKTSDQNGSLVSWGDSSNGGIWDFGLENGRLKLNTGGASLYGTSLVNVDQWKHVSVALPNGSGLLADCLLYVDGEEETTTITPFTWSPISLNPQVWFDANDTSSLTYDLSNVISTWQDKSTFTRDATTSLGAPVFNSSTGPNGMPTVEIRRSWRK